MFGASNSAVIGGGLLQLRALDWNVDGQLLLLSLVILHSLMPSLAVSWWCMHAGPFKNYPQITVYHPTDGYAFANIGWTGWIGSITGTYVWAMLHDHNMSGTHWLMLNSFSSQGFSSLSLAISEIGVSFPDETFGKESRFGIPFTVRLHVHMCVYMMCDWFSYVHLWNDQYILRDILQFDDNLDKAMIRLNNAHRTCDLILGVGDGKVCV